MKITNILPAILLLGYFFVAGAQAGMLGKAIKSGAKGMAATRIYRHTVGGEGALTIAMLERCIKKQKTLAGIEVVITATDKKIVTMEQELKQLKSYIDANVNKVDTTSQTAIDHYNGKIARYRQVVSDFNELIEKRTGKVSSYQSINTDFEKQCIGQNYYEDDYQKAEKKLGFGFKE